MKFSELELMGLTKEEIGITEGIHRFHDWYSIEEIGQFVLNQRNDEATLRELFGVDGEYFIPAKVTETAYLPTLSFREQNKHAPKWAKR